MSSHTGRSPSSMASLQPCCWVSGSSSRSFPGSLLARLSNRLRCCRSSVSGRSPATAPTLSSGEVFIVTSSPEASSTRWCREDSSVTSPAGIEFRLLTLPLPADPLAIGSEAACGLPSGSVRRGRPGGPSPETVPLSRQVLPGFPPWPSTHRAPASQPAIAGLSPAHWVRGRRDTPKAAW